MNIIKNQNCLSSMITFMQEEKYIYLFEITLKLNKSIFEYILIY